MSPLATVKMEASVELNSEVKQKPSAVTKTEKTPPPNHNDDDDLPLVSMYTKASITIRCWSFMSVRKRSI